MSIIRNITNCTKGGYLAVITGDDLDKATSVKLTALKDNSVREIAPENRTFTTLTFKVPEGKYQPYSVCVLTGDEESNSLLMNVPEIRWILEDGLYPGKELRIIGQGFVDIDSYKERDGMDVHGYGAYIKKHDTKVTLSGKKEYTLDIKKVSNYEITGILPENIECGDYSVTVFCKSWSEEYKIHIGEKKEYPKEVFNVLEYGAKSIPLRDVCYKEFFDSSDAFQKALDAAHENGGGTVFIPNGRYCFKKSIRIYPFTKLLGEDKDRVWLELPKGMKGEDGWGTYKEGLEIYTLIAGDGGDFTIENINMMGVYSPMLIAAPMRTEPPVIGDDFYNRQPVYSNLLDDDRDADNVIIRNCQILQQPTFLEHRKDRSDPFFMGGYDNGLKKIVGLNENYYARIEAWTAVAIKGRNLCIENNKIQGGGSCIRLMGAQNTTLKGNMLFSGDIGNCFGLFSTSYNPNEHWTRQIRNIIMEDNVMRPMTNVCRGVMWIMQEHGNYYMKGNKIDTYYYTADAEGFCFHLWGEYYRMHALSGSEKIAVDMTSLNTGDNSYRNHYNEEDKTFAKDTFKGYYFYVVDGRGIGQIRQIKENGADYVILDEPLDCSLDESSVISISDVRKFENNIIVENEVNELGRGIYYWGSCYNGIIDGNLSQGNSGILLEDLSFHYGERGTWQHAGHLFNQIINNKMKKPRGFCSNYGVVGVSGGSMAGSSTSVIIRGNVCEDDTVIVAKPRKQAKDGLNYAGVVIENNISVDCEVGIEVDENVSAALKDNEFVNVQKAVVGIGKYTKIVK